MIVPRPPRESDLRSESGIHIHLVRVDHRFPWLTQVEIEDTGRRKRRGKVAAGTF